MDRDSFYGTLPFFNALPSLSDKKFKKMINWFNEHETKLVKFGIESREIRTRVINDVYYKHNIDFEAEIQPKFFGETATPEINEKFRESDETLRRLEKIELYFKKENARNYINELFNTGVEHSKKENIIKYVEDLIEGKL